MGRQSSLGPHDKHTAQITHVQPPASLFLDVRNVLMLFECRSQLLYYNVIVAERDIPAFTEFTYNYGDMYVEVRCFTPNSDMSQLSGIMYADVCCSISATV